MYYHWQPQFLEGGWVQILVLLNYPPPCYFARRSKGKWPKVTIRLHIRLFDVATQQPCLELYPLRFPTLHHQRTILPGSWIYRTFISIYIITWDSTICLLFFVASFSMSSNSLDKEKSYSRLDQVKGELSTKYKVQLMFMHETQGSINVHEWTTDCCCICMHATFEPPLINLNWHMLVTAIKRTYCNGMRNICGWLVERYWS
jgi:hypothetical protein